MVIIQVAGGLGNQLQQFALYQEFLNLGIEAKLDVSWFAGNESRHKGTGKAATERKLELAYFEGLSFEVCTEEEKRNLIGGKGILGKLRRKLNPNSIKWFHESKMYHPELFSIRDGYLSGYFACEKYYRDILPDLRKEIRFPVSKNPMNQKAAEEMEHTSSVSIHIRRGDYLNPENAAMFGNICTEAYYEAAIEMIKKQVPGAKFYLFSDDIEYIKQKFTGEEYAIVDINHGEDSFYDMYLMSKCKHNICANSTFSFWGARLNDNSDKIMIRPTIHKNSQVFVKEEMEELWKGWRFVSPEGTVFSS